MKTRLLQREVLLCHASQRARRTSPSITTVRTSDPALDQVNARLLARVRDDVFPLLVVALEDLHAALRLAAPGPLEGEGQHGGGVAGCLEFEVPLALGILQPRDEPVQLSGALVVARLADVCAGDVGPCRGRHWEADVDVLEDDGAVGELELEHHLGAIRHRRGPAGQRDGQKGLVAGFRLPLHKRQRRVRGEGALLVADFKDVALVRGLVQIRVHLVFELLVLRRQLEADEVGLRGVEDRDAELALTRRVAGEAALNVELCNDLLLDIDLDRIEQRVHDRRSSLLLWRRCRRALAEGGRRVPEEIPRLLLAEQHALLRSAWLDYGPAVTVHLRGPSRRR
mmetsp:Transcript_67483/g.188298  ORF Transcript_67483/g.188298 Transcript_67483/m.188298 type:complete len:340 (-) Transcript_67483:654-1673(-)